MESNLLPILIAACVTLLVLTFVQILRTLLDPDRRKLQDRLSNERKNRFAASSDSFTQRGIQLENQQKGLSVRLAKLAIFRGIPRRVLHAFPEMSFVVFLCFVAAMGLAGFAVAWSMFDSMLIGCAAGLGAGYFPMLVLNMKGTKRQQVMAIQLPEALDFLSRVLKAGHSLSTGIQMMADELPKPLAN